MEIKIIKNSETLFESICDISSLSREEIDFLKRFDNEEIESYLINFKKGVKVNQVHNISDAEEHIQNLTLILK